MINGFKFLRVEDKEGRGKKKKCEVVKHILILSDITPKRTHTRTCFYVLDP